MDWKLICMLNIFMMLKTLAISLCIHSSYPSMDKGIICYSIEHILLLLASETRNASIIVRNVENWNAFIILHVILYFLRFTTNATPSVRLSQTYDPWIFVNTPLPYIFITNTATQFLGGNLLRNSFDILQTRNIEWFEQ